MAGVAVPRPGVLCTDRPARGDMAQWGIVVKYSYSLFMGMLMVTRP